MELQFVDPRALKENPDRARRTNSTPQTDALLLATIMAVGIVQPPARAAFGLAPLEHVYDQAEAAAMPRGAPRPGQGRSGSAVRSSRAIMGGR
jgi:hypothetical protein